MVEEDLNPDVLVIGAGPGGYAAAIRLAQMDKKVVIVEKEFVGGVCLNTGCIPTKALYSVTESLAKRESWARRGIAMGQPNIDLRKLRASQDQVVEQLTSGVAKLLETTGAKLVWGEAKLDQKGKVIVKLSDGGKRNYNPKKVIIASGSRPVQIPGFEFETEGVWDSTQALQLDSIPDRLAILGAGVIGLEMATIYSRLGSEVVIVELLDSILPGLNVDRRMQVMIGRQLKSQGITVHTGWKAKHLTQKSDGLAVTAAKDDEEKTIGVDNLLLAVGRRPNVDFLPEELGIEFTDQGFIEVDDRARTNLDGIYAIGDVAGMPLLAHKAMKQGTIAAEVICGNTPLSYSTVPYAIFTDPEFAAVGLSEEEARKEGHEVQVGRFPLRASGKAVAMDETEGSIKVIAEKDGGRILGCQILGPHASDLISELAVAIENSLSGSDLTRAIHPHPTLSEAVAEAVEDLEGRAIHIVSR